MSVLPDISVIDSGDLVDATVLAVLVTEGDTGPEYFFGTDSALRTATSTNPGCTVKTINYSRLGFSGSTGETLYALDRQGGPDILLVGCGHANDLAPEVFRKAGAGLGRAMAAQKKCVLFIPDTAFDAFPDWIGGLCDGLLLSQYRFLQNKSEQQEAARARVFSLLFHDGKGARTEPSALAKASVHRSTVECRNVAWARDLINTPASSLPPRILAQTLGERLEKAKDVEVEIWDEERIGAESMGGLLGVAKGSSEPPRFVRATYTPSDPLSHVVFVGKGITFDSGGLSIKTADGMVLMKTDMSGSAIVMGALLTLAELGARVKVTALAPLAENMLGGSAMKPGDVLTIRTGQTIEVLNTDAEGRLVLADALAIASEQTPAPEAIVDVATLTGAATIALGTGIAMVFSNNDGVRDALLEASKISGERIWPMPLPDDYGSHIDSDVADMKNTGRAGQAGAIAAAQLLGRFVGSHPWAHLDIAGPARSGETQGLYAKGGTAFSLRLLVAYGLGVRGR